MYLENLNRQGKELGGIAQGVLRGNVIDDKEVRRLI